MASVVISSSKQQGGSEDDGSVGPNVDMVIVTSGSVLLGVGKVKV